MLSPLRGCWWVSEAPSLQSDYPHAWCTVHLNKGTLITNWFVVNSLTSVCLGMLSMIILQNIIETIYLIDQTLQDVHHSGKRWFGKH